MNFTIAEENYIKTIYHLQGKTKKVNTNSVAIHLKTRPASVTDMLKKLTAKKLLLYKKYHGFKLNDIGNKAALKIIRNHRLWEYFLVSNLGFSWDKVHVIAEELEHVSSQELIKKLDNYLGNPKIDPHGDPIPDINGNIPEISQISLFGLPLKTTARVSSVSNQSPEMLEMLEHYGINIGCAVKVIKAFDFDGSLEIKILKKNSCIISNQVAENIFVYQNQQN